MLLDDFTGQEAIKKDLRYHIMNAKTNYTTLDHIMFYGPPGLGKTTLAEIIAKELGTNLVQITGQELTKDRVYDLLDELSRFGVLFIDEIHHTPTKVMEILYGPLQIINNLKLAKEDVSVPFDFQGVDIIPFTLIGATTGAGMVAKPLRDRIILAYHLKMYKEAELASILMVKNCPEKTAGLIAARSRGTPRIALNFFIRLRNEALSEEKMSETKCLSMFERQGIDEKGYDSTDIRILKYLYEHGFSSENELYRSLNVDPSDYKNLYEPFLLINGDVRITSRGRTLTPKGRTQYTESIA